MTFGCISDVFTAPWKQCTEAVWKKYPNEHQSNVKTIDVLDRKVTEDGRLLTTRLFGSTITFPSLIVSLLGLPEMCYAVEYSEVDLKTQTMTLRMINRTFSDYLSVDEKIVYTQSGENVNETRLTQSWKVGIKGIPWPSYFENMIVDSSLKNSHVGRSVVHNVVSTLSVVDTLDRITKELRQLSDEFDPTALNITDKMSDLAKDLDRASGLITDEIQNISQQLYTEMVDILNSLESELSLFSVKMNLTECGCAAFTSSNTSCAFESSKLGLLEAVTRAGITVKTVS
jgi:hypothetical protein